MLTRLERQLALLAGIGTKPHEILMRNGAAEE